MTPEKSGEWAKVVEVPDPFNEYEKDPTYKVMIGENLIGSFEYFAHAEKLCFIVNRALSSIAVPKSSLDELERITDGLIDLLKKSDGRPTPGDYLLRRDGYAAYEVWKKSHGK